MREVDCQRPLRAPSAALALVLGGALTLHALPGAALGLGAQDVRSSLGQPLRLVIEVNAAPGETVEATCFKVHPLTVANDGLPQVTSAQLALERRNGQIRLVVTGTRPIADPVVRLSIDVGCETALRRDLTLLLDPPPAIEAPVEAAAGTPQPAPSRFPAPGPVTQNPDTQPSAQPAPRSTVVGPSVPAPGSASAAGAAATAQPGGTGTVRPSRATPAARPDAQRTLPPPQALQRAGEGPARRARSADAPRDRLSISAGGPALDAGGPAPIAPRLALSTTLSDRSGQPPLPDSVLAILRQKQARLRAAPAGEDIPSMEAELVVLQKRTAELRGQLEAVMAQMQSLRDVAGTGAAPRGTAAAAAGSGPAITAQAPAAPAAAPVEPAPPGATDSPAAAPPAAASPAPEPAEPAPRTSLTLVWQGLALGLIIVLLLVLVIAWVRREQAERRRANRWNRTPYVPATSMPSSRVTPLQSGATADQNGGAVSVSAPVVPAAQRAPSMQSHRDSVPPPESFAFTPFSSDHAARDLGVSDLAQATEKASVFLTLGRPEQAIDVLRDHVDHEPKSSPMAWLMLLDLYRQTQHEDEFHSIAERFHKSFNAEAPTWHNAPAPDEQGLGSFPRLIRRIRADWGTQAGLAVIEDLLYDNRGGSRVGFSMTAFRDLLLLHAILETYLHQVGTGGGVQLEVPLPPPHLSAAWELEAGAAPAAMPEPPAAAEPAASPASPVPPAPPVAPVSAAPSGSSAPPATIVPSAPPLFVELPANPAPPASAPQPVAAAQLTAPAIPELHLDFGLLSDSLEQSAIEASYPIIAEAIIARWGKPGMTEYIDELMRKTGNGREASLSGEMLGELIMLHDVATMLEATPGN